MTLGLIWAQTRNGVIGSGGAMPWHLPEDARHFRRLTTGSTVVMGRKTWESLPPRFRPLPDRRNLVVTRQTDWTAAGAEVFGSFEDALGAAEGSTWVIGGGELYRATIGSADVLEVTEIDLEVAGDTRAPDIDSSRWHAQHLDRPQARDRGPEGDWAVSAGGLRYRFVRYVR